MNDLNAMLEGAKFDRENGCGYAHIDNYILAIEGFLKLRAEHEALKEQVRWRSVDKELPEEGIRILTFEKQSEIIRIAQLLRKRKSHELYWFGGNDKITHWRPLPDPPEE